MEQGTVTKTNEAGKEVVSNQEEQVKKLVRPEGEIEIPIGDGKRKKVFWRRMGFDGKSYFKAYLKSKINDMIEVGALRTTGKFKGEPEGQVDDKNTVFVLPHRSIDERTLEVHIGSTLKRQGIDYNYSVDFGVLFFTNVPKKMPTVFYRYFDPDIYREIYIDCFTVMTIFLCARELGNHDERVFKKVDEIGRFTADEIDEIVRTYTSIGSPKGDELKNS